MAKKNTAPTTDTATPAVNKRYIAVTMDKGGLIYDAVVAAAKTADVAPSTWVKNLIVTHLKLELPVAATKRSTYAGMTEEEKKSAIEKKKADAKAEKEAALNMYRKLMAAGKLPTVMADLATKAA